MFQNSNRPSDNQTAIHKRCNHNNDSHPKTNIGRNVIFQKIYYCYIKNSTSLIKFKRLNNYPPRCGEWGSWYPWNDRVRWGDRCTSASSWSDNIQNTQNTINPKINEFDTIQKHKVTFQKQTKLSELTMEGMSKSSSPLLLLTCSNNFSRSNWIVEKVTSSKRQASTIPLTNKSLCIFVNGWMVILKLYI